MSSFFIHNADEDSALTKSFKTFMETPTPTVETTTQPAVVEQTPDYKALLEKAEKEKDNYRLGLLKAKGKLPEGTIDLDEDRMEDLATRVAAKISPDLKSSLVSTVAKNDIDAKLDKLTANKDEKELIRYHFEFSTAGEDIDARLNNAYAIANSDLIKRKAEESKLAVNRRVNSTSMGSSTESGLPNVQDSYFTSEQLEDLKSRAAKVGVKFDPNKYKENIERAKRGEGMNLHTLR